MAVATRVLSAGQPLFEGESEFVVAQGADGELGVLGHHAPLATWLKPGELMVRQPGGEEHHFFLEGGFLEVLPERITVLTETGQATDQLDPEAAGAERQRAEEEVSRAEAGSPELERLRERLAVAERRLEAAERGKRRHRE
ncbi:MAG: ATP synthase F1 subunit epsilon [Candidatus Dormibacteria bacterium]